MDNLSQVADLVEKQKNTGGKAIAVVSTFSDITDHLTEGNAEKEIVGIAATAKSRDYRRAIGLLADVEKRIRAKLEQGCGLEGDARAAYLRDVHSFVDKEFRKLQRFLASCSEIEEFGRRNLDEAIDDLLAAAGEKIAAYALHALLAARGAHNEFADTSEIFEATENTPRDIVVEMRRRIGAALAEPLANKNVVILGGYVGRIPGGIIKYFGRGYTEAVAAATAVQIAEQKPADIDNVRLEVWKEVEGMMTADPRIVPEAQALRRVSYNELLQSTGYTRMKAINVIGAEIVAAHNVPTHVCSTDDPSRPGTRIDAEGDPEASGVRLIGNRKDVSYVRVESAGRMLKPDFAAEVFAETRQAGISVDVITTSSTTIGFSVDKKYAAALAALEKTLRAKDFSVSVAHEKAIVCCIGDRINLARDGGIAAAALAEAGLPVLGVSIEKGNISFVISEENGSVEKAVRALHGAFFGN